MWAPDQRSLAPVKALPAPRRFRLLARGVQGLDGFAVEQAMVRHAADGAALACVWDSPPALVVPASYKRFPRFEAVCRACAEEGVPVLVRTSGGGLVPLGPGMVNLSLAWRTAASLGQGAEAVYAALCRMLASAVASWGIASAPQAVKGSFCDGRYNLAIGGRKVAGTAQWWRRAGGGQQVVLAHACLMVDVDTDALTERANAFEAQLGNDRRYRADALTCVARHAVRTTPAGGAARITAELMDCRLQDLAVITQVPC